MADAIDEAIEVLNRILEADRHAITYLISYRVPCTDALADDPTVQVGPDQNGVMVVGLLGIVNGLFGVDERGWGFISAHYDDDGRLTHFARTVHQ